MVKEEGWIVGRGKEIKSLGPHRQVSSSMWTKVESASDARQNVLELFNGLGIQQCIDVTLIGICLSDVSVEIAREAARVVIKSP